MRAFLYCSACCFERTCSVKELPDPISRNKMPNMPLLFTNKNPGKCTVPSIKYIKDADAEKIGAAGGVDECVGGCCVSEFDFAGGKGTLGRCNFFASILIGLLIFV